MHEVFIVEDHDIIREVFLELLDTETDMTVCGIAETGTQALTALATLSPTVVLVDLSLPDMSGLDLIRELRAQQPQLAILVISGHQAARYRQQAEQAGADVYIDKLDAHTMLVPQIRETLARQSTPDVG
jgi:DNA-binding NarL/FixJ family response regulator